MGSQRFLKIFIAFITMMNAISSSLGARATSEDTANSTAIIDNLKHLCSLTVESTACWKIIEPQLGKFKSVDPKAVAAVVIDLAKTRGDENIELLKQLQRDSKDKILNVKYASCSTTYSAVVRDLVQAKRNLELNDSQNLSYTILDFFEQSESCRYQFEVIKVDPAHFRDRVKEYGVYVNIVKVAVNIVLHN